MNASSVVQQDESGIQTDLNRYKQAADLAYRYAKTKAERENQPRDKSSFMEDDEKEPTQNKENV